MLQASECLHEALPACLATSVGEVLAGDRCLPPRMTRFKPQNTRIARLSEVFPSVFAMETSENRLLNLIKTRPAHVTARRSLSSEILICRARPIDLQEVSGMERNELGCVLRPFWMDFGVISCVLVLISGHIQAPTLKLLEFSARNWSTKSKRPWSGKPTGKSTCHPH